MRTAHKLAAKHGASADKHGVSADEHSVSAAEYRASLAWIQKITEAFERCDADIVDAVYVDAPDTFCEFEGADAPFVGIPALKEMYKWAFAGTDGGDFELASINVTPTQISYDLVGHMKRGKSAPTPLVLHIVAEKDINADKMTALKISGDTDKFMGHFDAGAGARPWKGRKNRK